MLLSQVGQSAEHDGTNLTDATRYSRLNGLIRHLNNAGLISDLKGNAFVSATLQMRWVAFPFKQGGAVLFGGEVDGTVVAMVGSVHHMIGSSGANGSFDRSNLGSSWMALQEILLTYPALERGDYAVDDGSRRRMLENPRMIRTLVRAIGGPQQRLEFIAKVIARGEWDEVRSLIVTPLYVAMQ